MTKPDDNTPSADRREPSNFMRRACDELMALGREGTFTEVFSKLATMVLKSAPGGEPVFELAQVLAKREINERQRRLQSFVMGVVMDEQYNETVELREQDVIPVIRKLAGDDEAAKTEYYIRLTVALGRTPLSTMPDDLRYHFIRLVSSLTCFQIEFARELKIRKSVPVRGSFTLEEAELELTGQDSSMVMQAVRSLQNAGLLKEKARDVNVTWSGLEGLTGPLYDTTTDFEILIGLLFHPDDFEPETVGLNRKVLSDIIIVGQPTFIDNLYATYLPEALRKKGVKVEIVDNSEWHRSTHWAHLYLHAVLHNENDREFIKLHLTREGNNPTSKKTENLLNCKGSVWISKIIVR